MASEAEKKVDETWKKQIEDERRKAAEKTEAGEQVREPRAERGEGAPLPQASFNSLISSLANQSIMSLGLMEHPVTGKPEVDLDYAKYSIDTLEVIRNKTRGNLTDEEKRYLDAVLYDLRMRYVEAAR